MLQAWLGPKWFVAKMATEEGMLADVVMFSNRMMDCVDTYTNLALHPRTVQLLGAGAVKEEEGG